MLLFNTHAIILIYKRMKNSKHSRCERGLYSHVSAVTADLPSNVKLSGHAPAFIFTGLTLSA